MTIRRIGNRSNNSDCHNLRYFITGNKYSAKSREYNMISATTKVPTLDLFQVNQQLENAEASTLVEWSAETFGDGLVMSTSFGIQAAVMLHLVTKVVPNVPVIWVDTGYLPAETYKFARNSNYQIRTKPQGYISRLCLPRGWRQYTVSYGNKKT